jgi:hypothetical protein
LFLEKTMASLAASSMWRMRVKSSFRILHLRSIENVLPEVSAQLRRCPQIDLAPQDIGKFHFHSCQANKADNRSRHEFDQHVYIACRTEIIPEDGSEEGELFDAIPSAEGINLTFGNVNVNFPFHHGSR